MAKIRAAVLDAGGIFQGVEEIEEADLTARHLPQISECDLPPNAGYRWVPDERNSFGGAFVPPPRKTPEQKFNDAEPLTALCLFFIRAWKLGGASALPDATLAWAKWYANSFDFKGVLLANTEAQEFYRWAKDQEKT